MNFVFNSTAKGFSVHVVDCPVVVNKVIGALPEDVIDDAIEDAHERGHEIRLCACYLKARGIE